MSRIRVGLIGDKEEGSFIPGWRTALLRSDAEPIRLSGLEEDTLGYCRTLNAVMCHYSHQRPDFLLIPAVLDLIEDVLGLPIFPGRRMRILFDRKDLQSQILASFGLPIVPARCTDDYSRFVREMSETVFPIVIKYVNGAGSSQVTQARNRKEALVIGRTMARRREFSFPTPLAKQGRLLLGRAARFAKKGALSIFAPSYEQKLKHLVPWQANDVSQRLPLIYWQPFVSSNGDIRVTVIGDRAFTFRRGNRANDFRASGSGRISYEHSQSDKDAVKIAFEAEKQLNVGNVAFDFLRSPDGSPQIVEMSYGYLSSAVEKCPGHWLRDGSWCEESRKPEDLHVEWFLRSIVDKA